MFFTILFTFICVTNSFISATNICSNTSPCKCNLSPGHAIDITSVGRTDHPRYYEIKSNASDDDKLYSYNPCYSFDSPDIFAETKQGNHPCKQAAACVKTPGLSDGTPPEEYAIGLQSTAMFGNNTALGPHINYSIPNLNQKLIVLLKCSNETEDTLSVEIPENTTDTTNTLMTLNSKCACLDGCTSTDPAPAEGGMSTGSKLLIAFFTILLAYFVIGVVWKYCNGAQGAELVPNYEFWNELPQLIIEGLIFTCSCFSRKSTYGEV